MIPVPGSRCEWQLPATCARSSTTRTLWPASTNARATTAPLNPAPTTQYRIAFGLSFAEGGSSRRGQLDCGKLLVFLEEPPNIHRAILLPEGEMRGDEVRMNAILLLRPLAHPVAEVVLVVGGDVGNVDQVFPEQRDEIDAHPFVPDHL